MNDFSRLDSTQHMLAWLTQDPYHDIFEQVQQMLDEQVAGSKLQKFCVTSDPQWLTRAIKDDGDPNRATVIGAGVAFEFELMVLAHDGVHELSGVMTWVGYHLSTPDRNTKVWLDIGGTLDEFGEGGALSDRMYLQS